MSFPKGLALCKMQTDLSRIWISIAVFISYDDNPYPTVAYLCEFLCVCVCVCVSEKNQRHFDQRTFFRLRDILHEQYIIYIYTYIYNLQGKVSFSLPLQLTSASVIHCIIPRMPLILCFICVLGDIENFPNVAIKKEVRFQFLLSFILLRWQTFEYFIWFNKIF